MISGLIAIVGRPNVGKSTLFNKLARKKIALVDDQPGVTRDRLFTTVYYDKALKDGFTLIDTGGYETDGFNFQPFTENIVWQQTELAIKEADILLFLVDGKHGFHHHDKELYFHLVNTGKPVLCVVNKVDGDEKQDLAWDFYQLGHNDWYCISAAHSKGIATLLEAIQKQLKSIGHLPSQKETRLAPKIAIIGRPNAGKSSILNRITGTSRSLVSPVAGTTRDAIHMPVTFAGKTYEIIDTAGMRRKTKIDEVLESQSVIQSLKAITEADVVVMVIDAVEGLTVQDARLIHLAVDRYKPVLLVVNKWDLLSKDTHTAKNFSRNILEGMLKDHSFIPILFVSCLENQRVHQIIAKVHELYQLSKMKVSTQSVMKSLQDAVEEHAPQLMRKYSKRIKFYYATQVQSRHPAIVIKCNVADEIQKSYERYLLKRFRQELGFAGVPVQIIFRAKEDDKKKANRVNERFISG